MASRHYDIRIASGGTRGARPTNQDYATTQRLGTHYVLGCVFDGHGANDDDPKQPLLSTFFGEAFVTKARELGGELMGGESPVEMVEMLRMCYRCALEATDSKGSFVDQGTTLSAFLLQHKTMLCATVTLGDSQVLVVDIASGMVLRAKMLLHSDDAYPTTADCTGTGDVVVTCTTRIHDFTDSREVDRYQSSGLFLNIQARRDAHKLEKRVKASVVGIRHQLVEPSRTVESLETYSPAARSAGLLELQRPTEYIVWELPTQSDVAICALCDGFVSKNALPSLDALARCICDPGRYVENGRFLDGTVLGYMIDRKGILPPTEEWQDDPLSHVTKILHDLAPDQLWKDAIMASSEICRRAPLHRLADDPQRAVDVAVNLAVLFASDDNVTLEVTVVTQK